MRARFALCLLTVAILAVGCSQDQLSGPAGDADGIAGSRPGPIPVMPDIPRVAPGGYYSFVWGPPGYDFAYSNLSRIDLYTGAATHLSYIGLTPEEGVTPVGLAFDVDGSMYTTLNYMSFVPEECWSQLARVDPITGAVTRIGGQFPMNTSGPEIDACGNLYVLGFDVPHLGYVHGDRHLYRMDKATGAVTDIGYTGDDHEWMDMAFDSRGQLWGTWGNGLYRISTETGAATLATPIFGVPGDPPPDPYTLKQEVMSIAFDANDVLYGTAMNVEWDTGQGSPVMRIDTVTGQAILLGYLGYTYGFAYNHGGDIVPATVRVAHRTGSGSFRCITISMSALPAHLAHGDYVPGSVDHPDCDCP